MPGMTYRRLGRTDLSVSVIGLGTWQFGGEWGHRYTQSEVDAILDEAERCGINLIDTAECYGDHLSESLIGDYLARRNRSRWIIATKFGHQFQGFMDRTWHMKPAEVKQQLEQSLAALRIDAIDLYQFHSGSDEDFQQADLWTLLHEQKGAGKIRHLGVSISSKAGPLQAREARRTGAEVLQLLYNRLDRRAEQDFLPCARRDNLGVLVRVPLASGFLSGKYTSAGPFSKDDMRSTLEESRIGQWLAEVERIRRHELPENIPMAQWALAWCLRDPVVTAVIPGVKNTQQVTSNAAAAELV